MRRTKYKKQMELMEAAIKAKEAKKRAHEPFVLYRPWNITLDEHYVIYYPEGKFQKPQKYGPLSYADTCVLLATCPGKMPLQISMGECAEWLFAFHHFSEHSKLYTQEQLDRFLKKELEDNPELSYLITDDGAEMMRIMLKLPQVLFVQMKDLQKAIKEE